MSSRDELKEHFQKLFKHMKWADMQTHHLLSANNISGGKALELFAHIVIAEDTWYKRIKGEYYDNQFWKKLSLEECKNLHKVAVSKWEEFISSLNTEDFKSMISYKNSKGVDYVSSVEDIMTHVAMHGMYHRGQIMMVIRNAGMEPVPTDYAMYMRENESLKQKE